MAKARQIAFSLCKVFKGLMSLQIFGLLTLLLITTSAARAQGTQAVIQELPIVKARKIVLEEVEPQGSLILVKGTVTNRNGKRPVSFAVTNDLEHVIFGRLLNAHTGERLHIKKSPLPYKNDAHFALGQGAEEYFLFTDPTCPFCKKFEQQLVDLPASTLDKFTLYYFLYPIINIEKSTKITRYVLEQESADDRIKAMREIMLQGSATYASQEYTKSQFNELDSEIHKILPIAIDLGIRGTPYILNAKGQHLTAKKFFGEVNDG